MILLLVTCLLQLRDRFDEKEEKAKSYVEIQEYKEATKRTKRRKRMFFDESSPTPDTELTARDQFRVDVFCRIVDCLVAELRKRMEAYYAVHKLFGFLMEFESMTPKNLRKHDANLV